MSDMHVRPSISGLAELQAAPTQRACATTSLDVRIRRVQSILDFRWPDYQQVARLLAIAFYSDNEPWIPTVDQQKQQQQQQQPGAPYGDGADPNSGVAPSIDDLDLWSWGRTQEQQHQQQEQAGRYDSNGSNDDFRGRLGAEVFGWASLLTLLAQHVVYGRRHVTLLAEAGSRGQLVGCAGVTVDLAPDDVSTAVSPHVAAEAEAGAAADAVKGVPGGVPAAAAAAAAGADGATLGGVMTPAGGGGVSGRALATVATASAPAGVARAVERLRQGGGDLAEGRKVAEGAETAAAGTETAGGGPVLQPGGDYGLLTGLAVHPACRRRGVATALLTAAAELAAERVAAPALLALLVARTNTGAVRLYERAGFLQQAAWEDERWKAEAERGKVGKPRRLLMAKWVT